MTSGPSFESDDLRACSNSGRFTPAAHLRRALVVGSLRRDRGALDQALLRSLQFLVDDIDLVTAEELAGAPDISRRIVSASESARAEAGQRRAAGGGPR
jgi:hypothetical protein